MSYFFGLMSIMFDLSSAGPVWNPTFQTTDKPKKG